MAVKISWQLRVGPNGNYYPVRLVNGRLPSGEAKILKELKIVPSPHFRGQTFSSKATLVASVKNVAAEGHAIAPGPEPTFKNSRTVINNARKAAEGGGGYPWSRPFGINTEGSTPSPDTAGPASKSGSPKSPTPPVTTSLEKGVSGTTIFNPSGKLKKVKWVIAQNQKTGAFKPIALESTGRTKMPPGWKEVGGGPSGGGIFKTQKRANERISSLNSEGRNVPDPKWEVGSGHRGEMTGADKLKKVAGNASSSLKTGAAAAGRVLGGAAKIAGSSGVIAAEALAAPDPSSDEQVVGTAFPKAWNEITALLKKPGSGGKPRDIRPLPTDIEQGTSSRILREKLNSYARHATRQLKPEFSKTIPQIEASLTNSLSASTKTQQEKGRKTAIEDEEDRNQLNAYRSLSGKERKEYGSFEAYKAAKAVDASDLATPEGAPFSRKGTGSPSAGIPKAKREKRARVAAGADNAGVEEAGRASRERVARRTAAETLASGEVSPSDPTHYQKAKQSDPTHYQKPPTKGPRPSSQRNSPGYPGTRRDTILGPGAGARKKSRYSAGTSGDDIPGPEDTTKIDTKKTAPSSSRGQDIDFAAQKAREDARPGDTTEFESSPTSNNSSKRQPPGPLSTADSRRARGLPAQFERFKDKKGRPTIASMIPEPWEKKNVGESGAPEIYEEGFRPKGKPMVPLKGIETEIGPSTNVREGVLDSISDDVPSAKPDIALRAAASKAAERKAKKRGRKETILGSDPSIERGPSGKRKRYSGKWFGAKPEDEAEWEKMQEEAAMAGQRKGGEIKKKKATKAPAKKQYAHSHRARPKNPTISKTSYNY